MRPRIGLLLGDPCGIGPELIVKLLADKETAEQAEILLLGDLPVLRMGEEAAGLSVELKIVEDLSQVEFKDQRPVFLKLSTIDPQEIEYGRAKAAAGRSAIEIFELALPLAREGTVGGLCYGPLNKHAMHLAGLPFPGELQFFAHELGHQGPACELNFLEGLWTTRVTSHVPLKDVPGLITKEKVGQAIALAQQTLTQAGYDRPRIAVAALNPHGGESGDCGREEIEVISPAVERARAEGAAVEGPFPADTIFLRARDGGFDAVVTMYHDQGQVAMKLMGFDRGVSVQGGLAVPLTTPSHGTAFDIAGQGRADPGATRQAFLLGLRMIQARTGGPLP